MSPRKGRADYPEVKLCAGAGSAVRYVKVAYLVLEAFIGPRPAGMECRHLDDNRWNSLLCNLQWGTHAENARDMTRNGHAHVVRSGNEAYRGNATLTNVQVEEIRSLFPATSCIALGHKYGVKRNTISDIVFGRSWTNVSAPSREPSGLYTNGFRRNRYGESHPHAKLTSAAIQDILASAGPYGSLRRLAEKYGVTSATIGRVVRGKAWAHIFPAENDKEES
jgi:hypothetical protein